MSETLEKDKLYAALSKAQGEYLPLKADKTGAKRSGSKPERYCSLQAILNENVVKTNAKYGLCVIIKPFHDKNGVAKITVKLCHESGQKEVTTCIMLPDQNVKNQQHAWGGSDTYQSRYMVRNILGLGDNGDEEEHEEIEDTYELEQKPKQDNYITEKQLYLISKLIKEIGIDASLVLNQYNIPSLDQLNKEQGSQVIKDLQGE